MLLISGDWWDRDDFKDCNALTVLKETIATLQTTDTHAANAIPSLVQGSSTLSAFELLARHGLNRVPILNSEGYLTGMVTESMCISLLSQYKDQMNSFLSMPVSNMIRFLLPHRLIIVDEDTIAAEAFCRMVKERVTAAAVVNSNG